MKKMIIFNINPYIMSLNIIDDSNKLEISDATRPKARGRPMGAKNLHPSERRQWQINRIEKYRETYQSQRKPKADNTVTEQEQKKIEYRRAYYLANKDKFIPKTKKDNKKIE